MSAAERLARSAAWRAGRLETGLRRRAAIGRLRYAAVLADATVDIDVHPTARFEGPLRVDAFAGTRSQVRIGPDARIGEAVRLSLRGGSLTIGRGADVRRFCTFHLEGHCTVGDDVLLSQGIFVHCAQQVDVGDQTIIGEYSTLADSRHVRTPEGQSVRHDVVPTPVAIGSHGWLGASVVVTAGVTVGDHVFVGAHAVVTRDVPDWSLVAGNPARVLRALDVEELGGELDAVDDQR